MAEQKTLDETIASLTRMQEFESSRLARTEDLGREMSFSEIVGPAEKLVNFYKRLPISILGDLTEQQLLVIKKQVDADFNRFEQILSFSSAQPSAIDVRNGLVDGVRKAYDVAFNGLWQFVSYGVARVTDSTVLETQARSTLQSIHDQAENLTKVLEENKGESEKILADIKKVAAEQGVSQQAQYFKSETEYHEGQAEYWQKRVILSAGFVAVFAVVTLFIHKWSWLAPQNAYEIVQLVTSKVLIFIVLGYLVALAARNYISHRHNAVINRHRQNALMTYRALADAASEQGTEDIVLAHAASCIFSPQETGYLKPGSDGGAGTSKAVMELMTKSAVKTGGQ